MFVENLIGIFFVPFAYFCSLCTFFVPLHVLLMKNKNNNKKKTFLGSLSVAHGQKTESTVTPLIMSPL